MNPKQKTLYMVLALAIGIFLSANVLLSLLGDTKIVDLVQYEGVPQAYLYNVSTYGVVHWWDSSIKSSNTAILGDYKFVTTKYDRYATIVCDVCSGTLIGVDEYGCELYEQVVPVYKKIFTTSTCYTPGGCYGLNLYSLPYGQQQCDQGDPENTYAPYGTTYYHCVNTQVGTTTAECGGGSPLKEWGASYSVDIYKKDILVESKGNIFDDASDLKDSSGYSDITISAVFADQMWYEQSTTSSVMNTYELKLPPTAFSFEIWMPVESVFIKGQPAIIEVSVFNLYMDNILADITTTVCQPAWHGETCQDVTQRHTLPLGETMISFEIPTYFVTEKLEATPKITVYFDMNEMALSGVNINPSKVIMNLDTMQTCSQLLGYRTTITDAELCNGYIPLGSVLGDTKLIQVAPKPLYMNLEGGICTDPDYKLAYNKAYCIHKEVLNLTCVQKGCPTVEGHEYACTSAGICAETVFVTVWGTCPEGTTATTTSEGEKICIKTEIAEVILQCDMDSIPPAICEGITAVCVDNLWVFEGKCIAQPTVPSHLSLWDQIKTWLNWDKFWLTVMGKLGY